jgi:hypothetical protein
MKSAQLINMCRGLNSQAARMQLPGSGWLARLGSPRNVFAPGSEAAVAAQEPALPTRSAGVAGSTTTATSRQTPTSLVRPVIYRVGAPPTKPTRMQRVVAFFQEMITHANPFTPGAEGHPHRNTYSPRRSVSMVQGELNLGSVRVLSNDLKDADVEIGLRVNEPRSLAARLMNTRALLR